MSVPKRTIAVVSDSTGKDSGLTIELAIEAHGRENVQIVFCDTGNEHQLVYDHLEYQRERYGEIITLKADFTDQLANRREYVARVWPTEGVPAEIVERALSVLHPTGNPFLDLCLWKGRFPSRMAQFCTQYLKRIPVDNYMLDLIGQGFSVESWRGIRRDESTNRRDAKARENTPEGWVVVHPIVDMTAEQVIAEHRRRGLKLNPLYSWGFPRVGCMSCINAGKDVILLTSQRCPEHIDKLREWEQLVSWAAKRGYATFFAGSTDGEDEPDEDIYNKYRIDARIEWAKTSHGGRQYDLVRIQEPDQCSSVYGLCE